MSGRLLHLRLVRLFGQEPCEKAGAGQLFDCGASKGRLPQLLRRFRARCRGRRKGDEYGIAVCCFRKTSELCGNIVKPGTPSASAVEGVSSGRMVSLKTTIRSPSLKPHVHLKQRSEGRIEDDSYVYLPVQGLLIVLQELPVSVHLSGLRLTPPKDIAEAGTADNVYEPAFCIFPLISKDRVC